jgi:hypothetical protein
MVIAGSTIPYHEDSPRRGREALRLVGRTKIWPTKFATIEFLLIPSAHKQQQTKL